MSKKDKFLIISLIFVLAAILQVAPFLFPANTMDIVLNEKMVLGLLGSNSISILILILALPIAYLYLPRVNRLTKISFVLLISGAISNLLDRIFRGGALDYLKITILPVFNFADIFIVVSIISYALYFLFYKKPPSKQLGESK